MIKEIKKIKTDYFKNKSLNSSLIKNMNKYEELKINRGMIIGSIVDFYATENMSEFNNYFWG